MQYLLHTNGLTLAYTLKKQLIAKVDGKLSSEARNLFLMISMLSNEALEIIFKYSVGSSERGGRIVPRTVTKIIFHALTSP